MNKYFNNTINEINNWIKEFQGIFWITREKAMELWIWKEENREMNSLIRICSGIILKQMWEIRNTYCKANKAATAEQIHWNKIARGWIREQMLGCNKICKFIKIDRISEFKQSKLKKKYMWRRK